jgi:hypothetical protein
MADSMNTNTTTLSTSAASNSSAAAAVVVFAWLLASKGIAMPAEVAAALTVLLGAFVHYVSAWIPSTTPPAA